MHDVRERSVDRRVLRRARIRRFETCPERFYRTRIVRLIHHVIGHSTERINRHHGLAHPLGQEQRRRKKTLRTLAKELFARRDVCG
jgi:hypothetical protein